MRAASAHLQARPWRQAALLPLIERAPALAGLAAVAIVDAGDTTELAAILVVIIVLGELGSRLARRAAESMGVARPKLPGWVSTAILVAVAAVLFLALDELSAAKVAGVAVAEAAAAATARSRVTGT